MTGPSPKAFAVQRAYMINKKVQVGPHAFEIARNEYTLHWETLQYPRATPLKEYLRDGITGGDVFFFPHTREYWLWWTLRRDQWVGPFSDRAAVEAAFTLMQP